MPSLASTGSLGKSLGRTHPRQPLRGARATSQGCSRSSARRGRRACVWGHRGGTHLPRPHAESHPTPTHHGPPRGFTIRLLPTAGSGRHGLLCSHRPHRPSDFTHKMQVRRQNCRVSEVTAQSSEHWVSCDCADLAAARRALCVLCHSLLRVRLSMEERRTQLLRAPISPPGAAGDLLSSFQQPSTHKLLLRPASTPLPRGPRSSFYPAPTFWTLSFAIQAFSDRTVPNTLTTLAKADVQRNLP